jgi:hypothetical protein
MMSKSSWIGGIGMSIFYKEYTFLNVWWQGALAVMGLYVLLVIVHVILHMVLSRSGSAIFNIIAIIISLAGLYLTYHDFRHDFSHRIMGERFHIGFYLFWTGWIFIGLNFLLGKKKPIEINRKDEVAE